MDALREDTDYGAVWQAVATRQFADAARAYLLAPVALVDARVLCDDLGDMVQAGQAADLPAGRGLMPDRLWSAVTTHPSMHRAAAAWVPHVRTLIVDQRCAAERRLAAVAVALRVYAMDHDGQRPATLAGLVPNYLPAVPADPMSAGGPLLYRPGGPDPKLYSVGMNAVDNGGAERDPRLTTSQQEQVDDIVVHLVRQPAGGR